MIKIKLPTGVFEYDPARPLGKRGGFGQVFAGTSAAGLAVAVKKLHLAAAQADNRELRVADELKGQKFDHIIPFLDAGEDPDTGEYFFVMPEAQGNLQDAVEKRGKLNAADAAAVLLQIVMGLNEVDKLVHRDLKPDNILWHEDKWKVADFGIARFVEEATATNTLKDCLSPFYAAPEQWRFERATHATDVYALACIGFFLLTGNPPFVTEPEREHQGNPFPDFECSDSRLKGLLHNMARKLAETRPASGRVAELLKGIVAQPPLAASSSLATLAAVGAEIAQKEQQYQAKLAAERSAKEQREAIAKAAFDILSDNIERLWTTIHAQVSNAHRVSQSAGVFECKLGRATLSVNMSRSGYVAPGVFRHSGWDVVSSAQITVDQDNPQYQWSASLWYAKIKGSSEHRWHEVSYFSWNTRRAFQPFAATVAEADLAASNITAGISNAFGPVPIDDEKEDEFHERWIFLFARAATGQLRSPSALPIHNWPPQF